MPRNYHEPSRTDQILKKYDDLQERLFNERIHSNNPNNNNNLNYIITQHIQHQSPSRHHHHHHHVNQHQPQQTQHHHHHVNHINQNNHNHHYHNLSEANSPVRISNGERSSFADDDYLTDSFDFNEPEAILRLKWLDNSPRMSRLREHRQKRLVNKLEVFLISFDFS